MNSIPFGDGALELPREAQSWPRLFPGALAPPRASTTLEAAMRDASLWVTESLRGSSGRLTLVVPDRTRPLPLASWLPQLMQALQESGAFIKSCTIVPASGIHSPMSTDELARWAGPRIVESGVRLAPHDADAEGVFVGETSSGIRAELNTDLVEADALLALGRLVFHYLAGYGGGRKMIAPGCATRTTVLALHRRCLDEDPSKGRHPLARAGVLAGNPVNEAACEIALLLPAARGLHVALDGEGRCGLARFGDMVQDHALAAEEYGAAQRIEVEAPLDALIVSAGGHPVDRDLVQAHKALDAVAPLLAPGARVLLVARCGDGEGNRETLDALRHGSSRAINEALRREFLVGAHTALALREKTERFRVSLLGELAEETQRLAGIEPAASLESWVKEVGAPARVAVAPRGASALYSLAPGL